MPNTKYQESWKLLNTLIHESDNVLYKQTFNEFVSTLQNTINSGITSNDAIQMLAQHIIIKPVFDSLFDNFDIINKNPMSIALNKVLDTIEIDVLEIEDDFYKEIKEKCKYVNTLTEKQHLIIELYDQFFQKAFPKTAQQLGIVYTPIEVVNFIIHSVDYLLKKEFDSGIGNRNVHVTDPFTGIGTFITQLLKSGLIPDENLQYKYNNEIKCNEIILLAYYIAIINIEQSYNQAIKQNEYYQFNGIKLTDTFDDYEESNKSNGINVIIGNPPYSVGQKLYNNNNKNEVYEQLDGNIKNMYAKYANSHNKNSLYDSYIRAIRWGSDHIGDFGVLSYVTNGGWINAPSAAGLRKSLGEEYANLYVFNLRGNIRINVKSKGRAKEGGNIFGDGSMVTVVIMFLVKNVNANSHGNIYYYDIGDDLSTDEKIDVIKEFKSIQNMEDKWEKIVPDEYNDWINQRDISFYNHIPLGVKTTKGKSNSKSIFLNYSNGLKTTRDSWCYNSSYSKLKINMENTIDFYNSEVTKYDLSDKSKKIEDFLDNNDSKISWSHGMIKKVKKNKKFSFNQNKIIKSLHHPFVKKWLYYDKEWNEGHYRLPNIFPENLHNVCIAVPGTGTVPDFCPFITDTVPAGIILDATQLFPLKIYNKADKQFLLFEKYTNDKKYTVCDGITDYAQSHFTYGDIVPSKEDIFCYVYGILNHKDYLEKWNNDVKKILPRIPKVKTYDSFIKFSQAGCELARLHLNYESIPLYPVNITISNQIMFDTIDDIYKFSKMKHPKKGDKKDKTTIIYNDNITITDIPLSAYDYKINGRSPIEWIVEKQRVILDTKSGIVNDVNDYAKETKNNPKYVLELLQRSITLSLETQKIINSLPDLDF